MKKLFLLSLVFIFSFNISFAQYIREVIPEPMIKLERVERETAFSFWKKQLMKPNIISGNTSIQEWIFRKKIYYIIYGGDSPNPDRWPLLVKILEGGNAWKVIKNFDENDNSYDNYVIAIQEGCGIKGVNFFDNRYGRGAEFKGILWKKFPKDDFWKPKIYY